MNRNLLIVGAGGHGRVVKEVAEAMACFDDIKFLDDNVQSVMGKFSDYKKYVVNYSYAFVGIGNCSERSKWLEKLEGVGYNIPVLIHPSAHISPSSNIKKGTLVCPKAVINTNSVVEKGVIIGIGALIDHDCFIGQYSHVNTGAIVHAQSKVVENSRIDIDTLNT